MLKSEKAPRKTKIKIAIFAVFLINISLSRPLCSLKNLLIYYPCSKIALEEKEGAMLYGLIKLIFTVLVAIIVRPAVIGRDNLDDLAKKGPKIIASSHVDTLDGILAMVFLQFKLTMLFKEDNYWLIRLAIRLLLGGIVVRRFVGRKTPQTLRDGNPGAFKKIKRLLRSGGVVYFAPEGHRSDDGKLQQAKPGVGIILRKSPDVWIIPLGITGTKGFLRIGYRHVLGKIWLHLRGKGEKITLIIGKPFQLTEEQRKLKPQQVADLVMERIAELLPEEKRGPYATQVV